MVKVIGFDCDGVISDSLQKEFEVRKSILLADGKPFPYSNHTELRDSIELSIPEQWQRMGYDWEKDKKHLYEVYERARQIFKSTSLVPGIEKVLKKLSRRMPLCVISNNKKEQVRGILRTLGVEQYFEEVIGPNEGLKAKPSPDMINEALQIFYCAPDDFMYIGDTASDVQAGNAAGAITVGAWFPKSAWSTLQSLQSGKPDYLIVSPSDLERIL